tara:strand:+ start:6928 stop:7314 length:387 start_codon:yes stop_codon:yes gene_type:complete
VVGGKGMFDSLKKRSAQARMEEERFYAKVIEEYENGVVRHGLYAKAIEKSSGNPEKTKALYIQFRVRSLKDESELSHAPDSGRKIDADAYSEAARIADAKGQAWSPLFHILLWVIAPLVLVIIFNNLN